MKYRSLFSGLFLSVTANLSHATLIHQYDFNGNADDTLGGKPLVKYGAGTYNDNSTYSYLKGGGFALADSPGDAYTLDLTFQFSNVYNLARILNFSNFTSYYGLYYSSSGKYFVSGGATPAFGHPLTFQQPTRLTWVRDTDGNVAIYQDGALVCSWVDSGGFFAAAKNTHISFFVQTGPHDLAGYSTGTIDSLRVYNTALTADQINPPLPAKQPETPPGTPSASVPEPASVAVFGVGMALIGFLRRRQSRSLCG